MHDNNYEEYETCDKYGECLLLFQAKSCRDRLGERINRIITTASKTALCWTAVVVGFGMTLVVTLTTFTGSVKAVSAWKIFYCSRFRIGIEVKYDFLGPPLCGSPEKLENTTIIGTKRVVGSTIEYVCPEGYMLIGSKTRTCESSGFWSDAPPTCKCKYLKQ